jgi:thioredoxin 1
MEISSGDRKAMIDNSIFAIKDFHKCVKENSVVLVNVGADYCIPCHDVRFELFVVKQLLEGNANYGGKVRIVSIDADECKDVALELNVDKVPAQFLFKNGDVLDKHVGSATQRFLHDFIRQAFEEKV